MNRSHAAVAVSISWGVLFVLCPYKKGSLLLGVYVRASDFFGNSLHRSVVCRWVVSHKAPIRTNGLAGALWEGSK